MDLLDVEHIRQTETNRWARIDYVECAGNVATLVVIWGLVVTLVLAIL